MKSVRRWPPACVAKRSDLSAVPGTAQAGAAGRKARTEKKKEKIVRNRRRLAAILRRRRAAGERITLTNGVFDLLHVGHLRSLVDAKRRGGVLVVAVNSDASTRRLKGPGRPVVPLAERMEMLAALSCVDYVTPFSEPNVERLIALLSPDFHAKGRDYTPRTDPERKALRAAGGRTLIVGDPKRHSVTALLQKIRAVSSSSARPR